ncbi:hypothetical protein EDB19DRAFT_1833263 [Suillus lakei]|nr:hypothetical protein EDB19DRAFT_1833263 [Suillus lakei]
MPQSNSSVDSPKKTKQKKLTEEEVLVLKSHLEEWKEGAAKDRKNILKAVIKEAKVHAPAMDDWLLKKRKLVYRDWLYNRRPEKTRKKKASKYGQKSGSKKFIERYQTTLTAVMASLSQEQLEQAQKTVIEWSDKAPPAGVQADFAKKKAPSMMKDLATKLWKQASMRIFILSAWKAEEGELEGNSFTDTKDWKSMLSEWNAYAGEEFGLCSQQTKASVPWSSVRKAQGDFIEAKFLPTGCKLDNLSKIRLVDADQLLELWRQRQKDQVRPTFEFKAWEGDDKMMREPVEMISGNDSDIRPMEKSTGKRSRRMEQELSSEDDDNDHNDEDREDDKEEGRGMEDDIQSPPSKSRGSSPTSQETHAGHKTHTKAG